MNYIPEIQELVKEAYRAKNESNEEILSIPLDKIKELIEYEIEAKKQKIYFLQRNAASSQVKSLLEEYIHDKALKKQDILAIRDQIQSLIEEYIHNIPLKKQDILTIIDKYNKSLDAQVTGELTDMANELDWENTAYTNIEELIKYQDYNTETDSTISSYVNYV